MTYLYLFILVWLTTVRYIASLECYSCTDIEDLDNCHNTSQCQYAQSCYTNLQKSGQKQSFTLGCTDNQQCGTIGGGGPGIIGREISKRETAQCHECCSTDHCNNLLCSHLKPTTCIDDAKVDCAFLNAMFNICQDIHHSKTVCPKFCQLCDLVDGNWAEWSQWSICDVTCDNGTQTRKRTCTDPAPANNGLECKGNDTDIKACNKQLCPVHGGWTKWTEWGSCTVTCDVGIERRHRQCTNPHPSRYGDHCFGDPFDDRICMPGPCANGGWSDWGRWSSCSASCDRGFRTHSRECTHPRPSPMGKYCDGLNFEIQTCNKHHCEADSTVAFKADQLKTLTPSSNEVLAFTHTLLNNGNAYDNKSGQFIAPVNGTYLFTVQLCGYGNTYIFITIEVDNAPYTETLILENDDSHAPCNTADNIVMLSKGQTLSVKCKNRYGSLYQGSGRSNTFSGILIH